MAAPRMMMMGNGGDAVEDIHHTHDEVIHPAAEITGNAAEDNADDRLNDDDDEADHQRHTAAVHQAVSISMP